MFLFPEYDAEGYAVRGFGRGGDMTGPVGTALNDMHNFPVAPGITTDIKRIGTYQDTLNGVNTRIKKYFSHCVRVLMVCLSGDDPVMIMWKVPLRFVVLRMRASRDHLPGTTQ